MTDQPNTQPNAVLAYRTLDHITLRPDLHNQELWADVQSHGLGVAVTAADAVSCGTAACYAGWAVWLDGHNIELVGDNTCRFLRVDHGRENVEIAAARILRIDGAQADWLFDTHNTVEDLAGKTAEVFGPRPAEVPAPTPQQLAEAADLT